MGRIVSNYDKQVDMAKEIFLQYDGQQMIQKFGLAADAAWIYLLYMNMPCRIGREDGRVEEQRGGQWQECRSYNTVMTIYDLLCYSKGLLAPMLSGYWCALGSFVVTGVQSAGAFTGKYAAYFQNRAAELQAACTALGGTPQKSMSGADVTCLIPVTPFFPVLLQFWDADDEFPAKLMVLWDRNADRFLHFETMFFLQGDLLERLKRHMEEEK